MKGITGAVITGDIIGSTRIPGGYKDVLHKIGDDIKQHQDDRFIIDIYRGDSFQCISNRPGKGLLILLLIKAGLKRHSSKIRSEELQWDARMSLGIGFLEEYPHTNDLTELTGGPFTRSGRSLDQMKEKGRLIQVTTGEEQLDAEIASVLPMIEVITDKWSTAQADAVYPLLLFNTITQDAIGKRIGKSQRAVSKRLDVSKIEAIKPYLKRFEEQIKWTFRK
ncbi:hypothetical protein FNH22_08840 [Fulvivirga sp. M361]|uniref:hypothetical protein n=1 Tax=Fulvivirga sp. M361 TaxID=2594266 RepID=UPI001179B5DE|nr:hypothetical protein [Fulvivirga sp. M361]TRX60145.1 hypothetical protein FNH22_08840 [Fulvivirga sp. M361]